MTEYTGLEIAIIGISGRFPGANNIGDFWNNLKNGVESIRFFSNEELLEEGEEKSNLNNPLYVRANSYLDDKEYFDSTFFNYRPDEAMMMDPQMRILHECVWQAIEDAGYNINNYKGRIGLFTGASSNLNWENYSTIINRKELVDGYSAGLLRNVNHSNTRISYLLNLRGPSVFIDTGCSTSLVAIHQACNSLLLGECGMSVAGGITIKNYSKKGYLYKEGMISSKDGHCRAFDVDASGTIGGEGVGLVVLKKLKNALADNDNILAIIRGTGINNDGNNKVGYTAPSVDGQTEAIMMAIKMAKISPESISYVEAHGTATKLGDPIEIEALNRAFGKSKVKYCALGSVKTNIGHLDMASGVASFIKTVLALKHKQIPPSLHFKTLNPKINLQDSPFYINTELKEWEKAEYALRAGVSSFGIGGTNAHVILEEAPDQEFSNQSRDYQLIVLSAKTSTALKRNVEKLKEYLKENNYTKLSDIAYTLQTGRVPFAYRKMFVAGSKEDVIEQISLSELNIFPIEDKVKAPVIFMFPGQGSQYENMCYDLYKKEELFREEIDKCFEIVKRISGKNIKSITYPDNELGCKNEIDNTEFTQPTLFIIEFALAQLLMKWGINPDIVIGHSIGEYVAACVSGVFSLEDALLLVIKRGELMQKAAKGLMLSISISERELKPLLNNHPDISLAAINSTELCTASGEEEAIKRFKTVIEKAGYTSKLIRTSHAFHSYMMDDIMDEFEKAVCRIKINSQQIPLISNLSGKYAVDKEILNPQYWVNHLRQTVCFSKGIETILAKKNSIFIEAGPGNVLSKFVCSNKFKKIGHKVINIVRHPQEEVNDLAYLLSGIGELWLNGIEPDWNRFYDKEIRRRVPLPTYSFDKIKYPVIVNSYKMISRMISNRSLIKSEEISDWFYTPTWKISPPLVKNIIEKDNCKCTLIFSDNLGIGDALIDRFRQTNEKLIHVKIGNGFFKQSSGSYIINPKVEDEFQTLFKTLSHDGMLPDRIIHCWAISDSIKDCLSEPNFSNCCTYFFYSLVYIIKAAKEHGGIMGKNITVLSNDLHNILDNKNINPVKALILGLLKVISQEHPTISCSHIDISLSEKNNDGFINKLFEEVIHKQAGKVVSLRNFHRWEQFFNKIKFTGDEKLDNFKDNGVYIITGGLGNLGFNLANHLLNKYKARIILLGRSKIPIIKDGERFISDEDKSEQHKEKIRRIEELEKGDGEVIYFDCNIAHSNELENVINIVEEKYGLINGVIHAAGIVSGESISPFLELEKRDYINQFESKIQGLNSLKSALRNKQLDFCLITSSLSTVLGGLGFAAYASANTFMDYYLKSCKANEELTNWISINLDGINFNELQTNSIASSEIFDVINYVLSYKSLSQIIISTTDLYTRIENWVNKHDFDRSQIKPEEFKNENIINTDNVLGEGLTFTEETLVRMWRNFFGRSNIGVDDDFFAIGGNSLNALLIINKIAKLVNVEVPLSIFISKSNIKQISNYIEKQQKTEQKTIQIVEKKDYYPITSVQSRFYVFQKMEPNSTTFNVSGLIPITQKMSIENILIWVNKIVTRHEAFRTAFVQKGNNIYQRINDKVNIDIETFEIKQNEADSIFVKFQRPFDLSRAPILRIGHIIVDNNSEFIIYDSHHILSDRITYDILLRDFNALSKNEALNPLKIQYKDYSEWYNSDKQKSVLKEQQKYWLNVFPEGAVYIDLPTDFVRPEILKSEDCSRVGYVYSEPDVKRIRNVVKNESTSIFMFFYSVINILLYKITGQNDFVVGTYTFGRRMADLENIVGVFINTVVIRNNFETNSIFKYFLEKTSGKIIEAFENQDYPYEDLVDVLKVRRQSNRNPIFDIALNYQEFNNILSVEEEKKYSIHEKANTKVDLDFQILDYGEKIVLEIAYCDKLFLPDTIDRFILYTNMIIEAVLNNTDIKLSEIKIIDTPQTNNEHRTNVVFEF